MGFNLLKLTNIGNFSSILSKNFVKVLKANSNLLKTVFKKTFSKNYHREINKDFKDLNNCINNDVFLNDLRCNLNKYSNHNKLFITNSKIQMKQVKKIRNNINNIYHFQSNAFSSSSDKNTDKQNKLDEEVVYFKKDVAINKTSTTNPTKLTSKSTSTINIKASIKDQKLKASQATQTSKASQAKPTPQTANPTNTTNTTNSTTKSSEEILLMSHTTSHYYYKINIIFLIIYFLVSLFILANPDYPDFLKSTTSIFAVGCLTVLFFINFYAKRHIKRIFYTHKNNMFSVDTYGRFGFREKTYKFHLNDINEIVSASKYIRSTKTGVYVISFYNKENSKQRNFYMFNKLFMRPTTFHNKDLFDQLLKPKITR